MDAVSPCPYRFIYKGRTFCAIAIRERRYTTSEVEPSACRACKAQRVAQGVNCDNLELGVEVDQYGGSLSVDIFYASCSKSVERLTDTSQCGETKCSLWVPCNEERSKALKDEALAVLKDLERKAAA
jgi:hypothetical protein